MNSDCWAPEFSGFTGAIVVLFKSTATQTEWFSFTSGLGLCNKNLWKLCKKYLDATLSGCFVCELKSSSQMLCWELADSAAVIGWCIQMYNLCKSCIISFMWRFVFAVVLLWAVHGWLLVIHQMFYCHGKTEDTTGCILQYYSRQRWRQLLISRSSQCSATGLLLSVIWFVKISEKWHNS